MGHCPSSLVASLAEHAPASLDALIPEASLERILNLTDPMPAVCGGGTFECGLSEVSGVDFMLDVPQENASGLRPLAVEGSALGLMLERWLRPESLVHAMVGRMGLAFDLPEQGACGETTGCLPWLGVRRAFARNGRVETLSPAWLGTLCAELGGEGSSSAATHRLARCVATLPDGAVVHRVAALDRAGDQELGLQAAMRRTELVPWLDQIGWSGDAEAAREGVAIAAESGFSHLAASVDVGASVAGSLTLELACNDGHTLSPRWDGLFRGLVDRDLACGDRVAAVRRWWGRRKCRFPGAPWRVDLQRQFHVKLALDANGALAASASLSFDPRYVLV